MAHEAARCKCSFFSIARPLISRPPLMPCACISARRLRDECGYSSRELATPESSSSCEFRVRRSAPAHTEKTVGSILTSWLKLVKVTRSLSTGAAAVADSVARAAVGASGCRMCR
eukprot:6194928-Pleurochrysis_carterae.AAC.1